MYLSTKNISFAKGLARKLIPKFMGPYKILQDFGNSSFRLDLPSHLKRRGVHDVFHASLLREHIPNDDRLFPGQMDTQIGAIPGTEGEWAVDRILSHAGSRADTVFEIKWKSGDITWLPHYQITHLQALTEYLDLLGGKNIHDLPKGTGRPPRDDPQLFLGTVVFDLHITSTPTAAVLDPYKVNHPSPIQDVSSSSPSLVPQHYPSPTFVTSNLQPKSCPQSGARQLSKESTILTSLASHQPSTSCATPTTQLGSPSTWPKWRNTSSSTKKSVNSTSRTRSPPTLPGTPSSLKSGTREPLPMTLVASAQSTWQMTPRIATSTPPTIPSPLPISTSLRPKPVSLALPDSNRLPLYRTTSLRSLLPSWWPNKRDSANSLSSVARRESGRLTLRKTPPSEDQLAHLRSDHPKSVLLRSVLETENIPTNRN